MTDRVQLPAMDHALRRARVRRLLHGRVAGVTMMLVTDPVSVRYLSGFSGSNGQVLLGATPDEDRLVTDARYEERAATEAPDLPVIVSRDAPGVAITRSRHRSSRNPQPPSSEWEPVPSSDAPGSAGGNERRPAPSSGAPATAGEREWRPLPSSGAPGSTGDPEGAATIGSGGARLAVEADHLTWAAAQELRGRASEHEVTVVPTTGLVAAARLVKDHGELARLAIACAVTQDALAWLVAEVVAVGRTERELATALERRFVDLGADGVAFPSIVASGPNGAVPHHEPTDRPLRSGDLLTVDCGALVDGYHADHTRTVAVGKLADVPAELREIHELVVAAQRDGRDAVRAGVTAGDIDEAARRPIQDAGYGERFVHGTGHGVGLRIHEGPAVAAGSAATLVDGMALTVEPGVYLPGLGGVRIEDTIVVTADGPARPLTDTPRGLRVP